MKSTCYIFGAGASAAEGLPSTNGLFAHAYAALGPCFDRTTQQVWSFLEQVFGMRISGPDSFDHLPSVDQVISLVDHCIEEGQGLGHRFSPARLTRIRLALQHLLCAALDAAGAGAPAMGGPHQRFVRNLVRVGEPVGLISLNYDTLLDRALAAGWSGPDYGFDRPDWQPDPSRPVLAKLHGSLNWALCPACDRVEILRGPLGRRMSERTLSCGGCGNPRLQELIVAPSLRKRYTSVQLKHVWSLAFDMLCRAERIVFVGYSLPSADMPVLQLILRAIMVQPHRPALEVINHTALGAVAAVEGARQQQVRDRFCRLFGPHVRFDFSGFLGQTGV